MSADPAQTSSSPLADLGREPFDGTSDQTGRAALISEIFRLFDEERIAYCILHGYEGFPQILGADIDCVLPSRGEVRRAVELLDRNSRRLGFEIVCLRSSYVLLALRGEQGRPAFLALDFDIEAGVDGLAFYSGPEVLATRRRYGECWVPAPDVAFGAYLARSIGKRRLDEERARRLGALYAQDPEGGYRQLARLWSGESAETLRWAAASGNWAPVRSQLDALNGELRMAALRRRPLRVAARTLDGWRGRLRRVLRPEGINVVLLGPDGAGKSSLIDALPCALNEVLPRSICLGFVPALAQDLLHGRARKQDAPHRLPPRSAAVSTLRAVLYWLPYNILGYALKRWAMARSTLVLNDRHFVDVLVDRRRYRYGGPGWLLEAVWRVIPKPDLVLVLDLPPEVLLARKSEISLQEASRLRSAYTALARRLPNGHIVDASQPRDRVVDDAVGIVLRCLAARVARRNRLQGP